MKLEKFKNYKKYKESEDAIHAAMEKVLQRHYERWQNYLIYGSPKTNEELTYEGLTFKSHEEIKELFNLNPKEVNMYEPGPMIHLEALRASEPRNGRPVHIEKVDNGFKINIGCAEFVATSEEQLFKGLSEYWANPNKVAKKYYYDKQKK